MTFNPFPSITTEKMHDIQPLPIHHYIFFLSLRLAHLYALRCQKPLLLNWSPHSTRARCHAPSVDQARSRL